MNEINNSMYLCWLKYDNVENSEYYKYIENVVCNKKSKIIDSAIREIKTALKDEVLTLDNDVLHVNSEYYLFLKVCKDDRLINDGFIINIYKDVKEKKCLKIQSNNDNGILYGVFTLLRIMQMNNSLKINEIIDNPSNDIRMINQWDNIDGTVERGYAGSSIFYQSIRNKYLTKSIMDIIGLSASNELIRESFKDDYDINDDTKRIEDYARMLSSVGINSITINNTNVHKAETMLIEDRIDIVQKLDEIFSKYGIKVFLSINFASPITLNYLKSADPLDKEVISWWEEKIAFIYSKIPNLGGFMIKADSEGREGPFTYNRNHSDGANMFARILKKYNAILIWRCFVYNCKQDWRDYTIDRAKAAYDNFNILDGKFLDNVYLQIKNGPMDFQIKEPISPLFGSMNNTNKLMEFQITQEYTGQQKHVCYLVPMWKDILSQNTYANSKNSIVANRICGIAGISNIGSDENWTGHYFAQANLYGYGRLCWNSEVSCEDITKEWINMTFGHSDLILKNVSKILLNSYSAYENYTSPLGIGWMVNTGIHYGPDIDGYEYSPWGTYNRADCNGIGIDRTIETGTKYTSQYNSPLCSIYDNLETCPDELLLFFHHVPYLYKLKSGKTVIQHIYDSHFQGYNDVEDFITLWKELKDIVDNDVYKHVINRLSIQLESAREWRDRVNTYFYRMSGIKDKYNRMIY